MKTKGDSSSDWVWYDQGAQQLPPLPVVFDLQEGEAANSPILGPDGLPIKKVYRAMQPVGFIRFEKEKQ